MTAPAAGAPGPGRSSPWVWTLVPVAWLLVCLIAAIAVPGPAWRVGIGREAIHDYPRLFGLWSPAGAIALWLVAVPSLVLLRAGLAPRGQRRARLRWLLAWFAATLPLGGAEWCGRAAPHRLPDALAKYFPFLSSDLYRYGLSFFADDPVMLLKHRPDARRVTRVDYSRAGSLVQGRLVVGMKPGSAAQVVIANRRINSAGFAAEFGDYSGEWPEPEVVFLGDSFTFGYDIPADRIWPALLLTRLRAQGQIGMAPAQREVPDARLGAVLACGDYTPGDALIALRHLAPRARPRLAIALFFEGNDLTNAYTNDGLRQTGSTYTTPYRRAVEQQPKTLLEGSPLHAGLAFAFHATDVRLKPADRSEPWRVSRAARIKPQLGLDPMISQQLGGQWLLGGMIAPEMRPARMIVGGQEHWASLSPYEVGQAAWGEDWRDFSQGWWLLVRALDEMEAYRDTRGCRMVVALAPMALRHYLPYLAEGELETPEVLRFARLTAPPDATEEAMERGSWRPRLETGAGYVAEALAEACAQRGLEFIDLGPGLHAESVRRSDPLYFTADLHWSPSGHEAAAEVLGEWFEGNGD